MTEPLRIAYLADTMVDVRNVDGLAARARVTLVVPTALGERFANHWPPAHDVELVRLPGSRVVFALRAARWLVANRRRVDVAFALDNLVAAAAANLARRLGGPPVVIQVGRPTLEYVRCRRGSEAAWRHAGRLLLAGGLVAVNERLADGIGAVSEHCAAQCRRRNPRVHTIPAYGVDTTVFAPRWSRRQARRMLGLDPDRPLVLLRSRLAPEKDPKTFLHAVRLLRAAGREFTAASMGGEYRDLARLARGHGVELVARAPSGFEEIPVWYAAADVVVQTSRAEGLGISPLEALACGTPVVASDVGGLREVADGGRVATLVPPGDPVALAAAIAAVLDDPTASVRAAREGRAWVVGRYEATRAFDAWVDLAREVARLRVLFVDHETRLSGGERDLVELVTALGHRIDAHVALPADGPLAAALRDAGATVHIVPMGVRLRTASRWELGARPAVVLRHLAPAIAASVRLARLARRLRPAVVHSNSQKAHVLAVPAALAARAPHVWHVHDILEPGPLRTAFNRLAGIAASRVIAISHAVAAGFDNSAARTRVRVVYPGVTTLSVCETERGAWRRRFGVGDGEHLVGSVGQIAHWKGQDVFLAAARLLAERRDDVRFVVVGDCLFPGNEAAFEARIRHLADTWGLGARLVWAGRIEPVDPVMAALDVLVHASRLPEPFGRVIVEALAQGTPVVATGTGAVPEILRPGAGVCVAPDRPDEVAAAVEQLLVSDPARADAARAVAARFSPEANRRGVEAVWAEVLP